MFRKKVCFFKQMAVLGIFGFSAAAGVVCAATNKGQVADLIGANAPFVYVNMVVPPNGYAACATLKRYIIDLTTPGGKYMYAIVLTAKAAGKEIVVIGGGTCKLMPNDAEDVLNVATAW